QRSVVGFRDTHAKVPHAAQFGNGRLGVGNRLTMLTLLISDLGDPGTLDGLRDNRRRPAGGGFSLGVGALNLSDVVAIDLDGVPAECPDAVRIGGRVPAVPG